MQELKYYWIFPTKTILKIPLFWVVQKWTTPSQEQAQNRVTVSTIIWVRM